MKKLMTFLGSVTSLFVTAVAFAQEHGAAVGGAVEQVAHDHVADRAGAAGGPDHGKRGRLEQLIEITLGHRA